MSINFGQDPFRRLLGFHGFDFAPKRYLTPAGRMLDQLKAAEHAIEDEGDITDELRCALRWIQKPLVTR